MKKELTAAQYPMYLVGVSWYSEDQGAMQNYSSFPSSATPSAEDASRAYEELAREDREWNHGFQVAYIVGVRPDGGFDLLKGANPDSIIVKEK